MKADVSPPLNFVGASRAVALRFAAIAILLAELSLLYAPRGFDGGPSDDQRYFDVALAWFQHGAQAGTTHWALRFPLILTADALFALIGPTIAALLLVPKLYYALFVGVTAATVARLAGLPTARWWLALAICSPVLHRMGSTCYPEIVELALGAVSLAAFLFARRASRAWARLGWLALSGLSLGIATITRETAAVLLFGYAWAFVWRPGMPRGGYVLLAAAFVLPIAAQFGWLWAMTGDPLYRIHVDEHHVLIASDHMRGKVYHGSPFLNPDLARRWKPAGPTRINWTVNPLGDFLVDPNFGFAPLACLIAALPVFRGGRRLRLPPHAVPLLLAIAIGSYVIVTWVFTLRPQPRYYLPAAVAAQIGFALAMVAMRAAPALKVRASVLAILAMVGGVVTISMAHDAGWQAHALVPYMAAHPGAYAAEPYVAGRSRQPAIEAGVPLAGVGTPPVGGYRVRVQSNRVLRGQKPFRMDANYAPVTRLYEKQPALTRLLRPQHRRALLVERRLY